MDRIEYRGFVIETRNARTGGVEADIITLGRRLIFAELPIVASSLVAAQRKARGLIDRAAALC